MKKILTTLLYLIPMCASAQYSITKDELNAANIKKEGQKVDVTKQADNANEIVKFTGLTGGDNADIELKEQHDQTKEHHVGDIIGGVSQVDLKDVLATGETTFLIYYKANNVGSIQFDVTGATKPATAPDPTDPTDDATGYLGVLTSANFTGNNKFLSDLTPIVNLGGIKTLFGNDATTLFSWKMDVNPYLGSQINTTDKNSLIPALMLYGRAGFAYNNYININLNKDKGTQITLMPFGFGLKFIPNLLDQDNLVIQHNIRFGLGLKVENTVSVSAQITHGWHNISVASESDFNKVFGTTSTNITYATLVGQIAFTGKADQISNYLYFEWRGLLSKDNYATFTNNRILTLGFRKTLDLSGGNAFAAASNGSGGRKRVRASL